MSCHVVWSRNACYDVIGGDMDDNKYEDELSLLGASTMENVVAQ